MAGSLTLSFDKITGHGYRLARGFYPGHDTWVKNQFSRAFASKEHLDHAPLRLADPRIPLQSVPYPGSRPGSRIELQVFFNPPKTFTFFGSYRENVSQLRIDAMLVGPHGASPTPVINNTKFQADAAAMATFAIETGQQLFEAEPYLVQRNCNTFHFHFSSDPGATIEAILANYRGARTRNSNFILYPLDDNGSRKHLSIRQVIAEVSQQNTWGDLLRMFK
jgi:hypothetical protein